LDVVDKVCGIASGVVVGTGLLWSGFKGSLGTAGVITFPQLPCHLSSDLADKTCTLQGR
jgi:hypothetical protein